MRIYIKTHERAILLVNGLPERWLEPGRHRIFAWFRKVEVKRFDTDALIVQLRPEYRALAPTDQVEPVLIEGEQRAIVWQRGKPARWLGVGLWHVWRVDSTVRVERVDVTEIATKPLAAELAAIVSPSDYVEQMVPTGFVAQRYVDGALDAILKPGRHAAWTITHKVTFALVDLRERILQVSGQDVMTRDRVTLRLNVAATFRVADPQRLAAVA
ncbi:MAG: SPFH domain-containing protein, partial [Myxococcota bacterium]|nr:SPFH domain-containing protein [Myxococcota bacterium]